MSASLVGSEMCIRDRVQRPDGSLTNSRAEALGILWESPQRVWSPRGPVSYTHLTLPTICSV
eukprot:9466530-Alexandrium_andersonii.AAC.1